MSSIPISGGVPTSFPSDRVKAYFNGSPNAYFLGKSELLNPPTESLAIPGNYVTPLSGTHTTFPADFFGILWKPTPPGIESDPIPNIGISVVRGGAFWREVERQIISAVRTGNTVVVNLFQPQGGEHINSGDSITIKGITEAGFNGVFPATRISATSFSYQSPITLDTTATTTTKMLTQNWTTMDNWVTLNKAKGRKLLHFCTRTPTWAAARQNDKGPYNWNGDNSEPASMADLGNFITDAATRYASKGQLIDYWSIGNEVNWVHGLATQTGIAATGVSGQNTILVTVSSGISIGSRVSGSGIGTGATVTDTDFINKVITLSVPNSGTVSGSLTFNTSLRWFSGTQAKLSEMVRTVNQAVKAVMPTAKIIAPSITGLLNTTSNVAGDGLNWLSTDVSDSFFPNMLAASDGAGGTMSQWVDIISYHDYSNDGMNILRNVAKIKSLVASIPAVSSLPIWNTEFGSTLNIAADYDTYLCLLRQYIICRLSGISHANFYQVGTAQNLLESLLGHSNLIPKLANLISDLITYGVDSGSVLYTGEVVFIMNGKTYTI
jgi:hypothetical protein